MHNYFGEFAFFFLEVASGSKKNIQIMMNGLIMNSQIDICGSDPASKQLGEATYNEILVFDAAEDAIEHKDLRALMATYSKV